jgi:hypothetical protein
MAPSSYAPPLNKNHMHVLICQQGTVTQILFPFQVGVPNRTNIVADGLIRHDHMSDSPLRARRHAQHFMKGGSDPEKQRWCLQELKPYPPSPAPAMFLVR